MNPLEAGGPDVGDGRVQNPLHGFMTVKGDVRRDQRDRDHICRILAKQLHARMHAHVFILNYHFIINTAPVRLRAGDCDCFMCGKRGLKKDGGRSGDGHLRRADGTHVYLHAIQWPMMPPFITVQSMKRASLGAENSPLDRALGKLDGWGDGGGGGSGAPMPITVPRPMGFTLFLTGIVTS